MSHFLTKPAVCSRGREIALVIPDHHKYKAMFITRVMFSEKSVCQR